MSEHAQLTGFFDPETALQAAGVRNDSDFLTETIQQSPYVQGILAINLIQDVVRRSRVVYNAQFRVFRRVVPENGRYVIRELRVDINSQHGQRALVAAALKIAEICGQDNAGQQEEIPRMLDELVLKGAA